MDRAVIGAVAMLIASAVFACVQHLPLIWDGAYQLLVTLTTDKPYVYQSRFHTWLLWWPTVWTSRVTTDPVAIQLAYGLPFLLGPAVSVGVTWWFVRREMPEGVVIAALGSLAITPGQVFVINDSVLQSHLFLPVLMGLMVRLSPAQWAVWGLLVVFQFAHQIGAGLLTVALFVPVMGAVLQREERGRWIVRAAVVGALMIGAWTKVWWVMRPDSTHYDSYAAEEMAWETVLWRFEHGVWGWPIVGLLGVWVLAMLLASGRGTARVRLLMLLPVLGWIWWAGDFERWRGAIDYRRFVAPLSMPIYLAAGLMCLQLVRKRAIDLRGAGAVVVMSSAVLSLVLAMQAWQFGRFHWQFADVLAESESPVLRLDRIPGIERTPLNHWGSISHALLLQSPEPRVLVFEKDEDLLPLHEAYPAIKFAPFHQLYRDDPVNRWLRIGPLIERVVHGRPIPEQTLQAD